MIIKGTKLAVVDNSGPLIVKTIHLYSKTKFATLSNLILLTVKSYSLKKKSSLKGKEFKRGDLVKGVICQVKKPVKRYDGTTISFSKNSCFLLSKNLTPLGTRFLGPGSFEIKLNPMSSRFLTMFPIIF